MKELGDYKTKEFNTWREKTDAYLKSRPVSRDRDDILLVERRRSPGGSDGAAGAGDSLSLRVNFDNRYVHISKEIRNLEWILRETPMIIPEGFKAQMEIAMRRYPFAVALESALRSYEQVLHRAVPAFALAFDLSHGAMVLVKEDLES